MKELLNDPRLDDLPGIVAKRKRPSKDIYRKVFEERFGHPSAA